MPQIPRYLSPTNGFIPEASGQAIAYVRDKKRFKINQYVQLVNAPKPIVLYATLDPDQPARVPNADYFKWPPGNLAPSSWNNTGNFIWTQVEVERYAVPYTVDYQAVEAADGWNPKAFFSASSVQQAMTIQTQRLVALVTTVANWSTFTGDANTLNGGFGTWNLASDVPGSPNFLAIKKTLLQVKQNIALNTNGMVGLDDLILVIGPDLAASMAETSEIHHYLARQERSLAVLKGEDPDVTTEYGLPNPLYGFKVVVEDGVQVTQLPDSSGTPATTNRSFIFPSTMAVVCSRPGGLNGSYGSPSYSTLQRYFYKYDMSVETFDRPRHKLFETRVVDQFKEVLAAARSGYLVTNCQ